jgi:signal transduction histidine kinase
MVWLRTDAEPLRDPAGEVVGAVAMVVDITQEKRAEEEHRFLAEVGAILGSSLDLKGMLDGFVEVAVARQADLCGVYLIDEESGEFRRQSIAARSPELAELVSRIRPHMPVLRTPLLREVAFSGEPYLLEQDTDEWMRKVAANEEHLELMRELRLHSVLYLPLLARGHTFGALVCARAEPGSRYTEHDVALAEEVSRRLALAIDNIRLYDSALAGSRAKSEFLAVMSHELRTPLNAIVGYSDLLLLGLPEALSKEAGQAVERILGSADHLRELIDEILSFSRMEAGSEVVHTEQADLGYLVRSVAAGAEALAREKGLDFDLQLPAPSVAILTDQDKLRQILRNLLSNAIKFTTQGEVGLEVGLAGSDLIVHVRDTGPGIAPELRERIFEPFWQLEQGRTRRVSGTGLGLGVSRLLARMLGGDITVESEPGKGSTFTVRVPAGLEDESIDE